MCCIFTYIAWTIDFIQRIWTFLMSCCIGFALCILLLVAVVAGIAFGYNYSLSEYEFRKDSQTITAFKREVQDNSAKDGDEGIQSNILDNSLTKNYFTNNYVLDSENHIKYEKPLSKTFTQDLELDEIINQYPSGSVDQMKAILNHIYVKKLKKSHSTSIKKITTTVRPSSIIVSGEAFSVDAQLETDKELTTFQAIAKTFLNISSNSLKSTDTLLQENSTITS